MLRLRRLGALCVRFIRDALANAFPFGRVFDVEVRQHCRTYRHHQSRKPTRQNC
jgi:hypothetical protein